MGRAVGIEDAAAEVLELVPVGHGPRHPSGHVGPPEALRRGRGGRQIKKRKLGPNPANNYHLQSRSDHPEQLTFPNTQ